MFGYALLGAGWLVLKTEGPLQRWSRRAGQVCLVGVMGSIGFVSLWTPFTSAAIAARWFGWPNTLVLAPLPVVTVALAAFAWWSFGKDDNLRPFLAAVGLFLLSFLGVAISLWPMIVPGHYTLWQAAAGESAQVFLLVGTLFLLPVVLFYTGWSYWVFRGKVREGVGYH